MVVGAGPAGASLALLLAQAGLQVTLVEAKRDSSRRFRGEALMPHGLAALEAMGLWPLTRTIPQRPLAGWRFLVHGRELFQLPEPLETGAEQGCTLISQPALLEHLLARLERMPTITLRRGQRVEALHWQEERVCGVRLADGTDLPADLVVAADGRSSRLRQLAHLPLEREGSPFDLLWYRLDPEGPSPLAGLFTTLVGPAGLFSAFDAVEGGVQIGWVRSLQEHRVLERAEDWLEHLSQQSPADLATWWRRHAKAASAATPLRVDVGHARQWWRPGLLLLGDAAHPMSPVRAQGINLALRDAWVAARQLVPLLARGSGAGHGNRSDLDAALQQIERLRRPEVTILQRLQAAETDRGKLLLHQPLLRHLLAAPFPWLGGAVARRWRHDQKLLRQGVTPLPP